MGIDGEATPRDSQHLRSADYTFQPRRLRSLQVVVASCWSAATFDVLGCKATTDLCRRPSAKLSAHAGGATEDAHSSET